MARGNRTNHPLKSGWRDFTIEQLEAMPKSKREAKPEDKYYYSGECINGHFAPRYVSSKSCAACQFSPDKKREYQKKYHAKKKAKGKTVKLFGMNVAILK